jgi:hypothetical protein
LRGGAIFLAFFALFTVASFAVPVPLFPGNVVPIWFSLPSPDYASLVSAVVNGVTYGLIVWLVFVVATRRLAESGVADYKNKKDDNQRSNKRSTVKS